MGVGSYVRVALIALPCSITFLDVVAYVAKVEGISMQPTLNPEDGSKKKDFVLLNRWSVKDFNVNRGDIVSLASPRDPEQKIIKRVIGLEGDTIKTLGYKQRYVEVPQGHCWVEGDHNKHSMDSNYFGPVALGLITARASHIVWPPERWQKLESRLPLERTPSDSGLLSSVHEMRLYATRLREDADELDSADLYLNSLWSDAPSR